jgi:hypothetical protein
MVRDLRDNGAGAITSEGEPSSGLESAHPMKPPPLAEDILLTLAQSETSGTTEDLQAAYEELFWFCYRNHLDPSVVLRELGRPAVA